jgi:hypothetical protein
MTSDGEASSSASDAKAAEARRYATRKILADRILACMLGMPINL